MPLDVVRTRHHLKDFNFKNLFIEELGWNHCSNQIDVTFDDNTFSLTAVAEKHGMVAFTCNPSTTGLIPDYSLRRKIERQAARSVHEHIIAYTNSDKTSQIWQWVKRETGKPTACREHAYHVNQPGDSLIQKLQSIVFSLEEEETLTIVEVAGRAKAAFDVERITKRFYDRFKAEHDAFLKFIDGIPDDELQRWYASVMLNRMMFIYFIQSKGFLDTNTNYLKNKLAEIKQTGENIFYRKFLCPLFFEGFAKKASERSSSINKLLGEIPYLNGGLFLKHRIEELHGRHIEISDKAFEKLFDFFDIYHWHLDERPLKKDNEINPDVLGYIFEKYINQKQMGAYYTQEDITGSISKNTIIPFIFDVVRKNCKAAFEGENSIWRLLENDPDRYVYDSVKLGVIDEKGNIIPEFILPDYVQKGMHDPKARMFDKRYNLSGANLQDDNGKKLSLPTETWREYVERRNRCLELRKKLANGDLCNINDFITYNLNILQFTQDVIENCDEPELLRAFWRAIEQLKALDPTCGSGAFIFAVLNILELLYEACLQRMQIFLDELERSGEKHRADKYGDFKQILKRVGEHPNPRYFIFKSIIVNNLYGVDIMEEAVEICKLRLFLKLVAQVEKADEIEPLPDIDFNIRAGNTLVGFVNLEEIKKAMEGDWIKLQSLPVIKENAELADRAFRMFQEMQTKQEMESEDFTSAKLELRKRLTQLEGELNQYLAGEYGIDVSSLRHSRENGNPERHWIPGQARNDKKSGGNGRYQKWLDSHKPFHWFIEFYGILKKGGFDVIIGNPPYVEYSKVKKDYTIKGYVTEPCGDLYAYVMERSLNLSDRNGRCGLIVRLSSIATQRTESLRKFLFRTNRLIHISTYSASDQPASLFSGVRDRLCIYLLKSETAKQDVYGTNFLKWFSEERGHLFSSIIQYDRLDVHNFIEFLPKIGHIIGNGIYSKLLSFKKLSQFVSNHGKYIVYYHESPVHWHKAWPFIPYYFQEDAGVIKSCSLRELHFEKQNVSTAMLCIANSSLFYWFFNTTSDCRHLTFETFSRLPLGFDRMSEENFECLNKLAIQLINNYKQNKKLYVRVSKKTGVSKFDAYYPAKSKPIIDEIDRVLANHYGFTDEELDFIINYDIKYRMGRESEEE